MQEWQLGGLQFTLSAELPVSAVFFVDSFIIMQVVHFISIRFFWVMNSWITIFSINLFFIFINVILIYCRNEKWLPHRFLLKQYGKDRPSILYIHLKKGRIPILFFSFGSYIYFKSFYKKLFSVNNFLFQTPLRYVKDFLFFFRAL